MGREENGSGKMLYVRNVGLPCYQLGMLSHLSGPSRCAPCFGLGSSAGGVSPSGGDGSGWLKSSEVIP